MPSHIHIFFSIDNEKSLKRELEEFKRWTGHQATKICPDLAGSRFWQTEWFDHWSRSDEEDTKIIRYIEHNPVKAKLATTPNQYAYLG
jgi:REP element-mobilizing transposase RayT